MTEKILLTGVTGFLGSHLASAFLAAGYKVLALKRSTSSLRRIETIVDRITLIDIDSLDFDELFMKHGTIDVVIHTATSYGRVTEPVNEIFAANTFFPLRLLEASSRAGIKVFMNTDTILDQYLNPYSLSKNQFLQWGKFFSNHKKIKFINIRLEHFYGPADDTSKFSAYVLNQCLANVSELELTLGEQKRDFVYIDDVVTAYLVILKKVASFKKTFREFEVGSGNSISIRSFVNIVHRLTGSKTKLIFGVIPYRAGEVMHSKADISELTSLGWKCQYDLMAGLNKVIEQERAKQ
jgi:CDP-paratose synthetase